MPIKTIKKFLDRQAVLPFESCFAFFCIFSGLAGLLDLGPSNVELESVLGSTVFDAFNYAWIVGGFGVYFGLGFNRSNLETFGLVLIVMCMFVRSMILLHSVGLSGDFIAIHIYSIAFAAACAVRVGFIAAGKAIVKADNLNVVFSEVKQLRANITRDAR